MLRVLRHAALLLLAPACGLATVGTGAETADAGSDATSHGGRDVMSGTADGPAGGAEDSGRGGSTDSAVLAMDDGGARDGAGLADAPACSCPLAAPAGWTLVGYATDRTTPCPASFTESDLLTSPVAGAGACTCAMCTVTTQPSCTMGSFTSMDGPSTCDGQGLVHPTNGGSCTQYSGGPLSDHGMAVAPGPMGGQCTAMGIPNALAVTSEAVRACIPPPTACACAPTLPATYVSCLFANGEQTCPVSAPTKVQVGTGASVDCGACPCSVQGTCSGSASYYTDQGCTALVATITTSNCSQIAGGSYWGSYEWQGSPVATCTAGSPSAGTPSLTGVGTICCP
jgi:hypothetical protein